MALVSPRLQQKGPHRKSLDFLSYSQSDLSQRHLQERGDPWNSWRTSDCYPLNHDQYRERKELYGYGGPLISKVIFSIPLTVTSLEELQTHLQVPLSIIQGCHYHHDMAIHDPDYLAGSVKWTWAANALSLESSTTLGFRPVTPRKE